MPQNIETQRARVGCPHWLSPAAAAALRAPEAAARLGSGLVRRHRLEHYAQRAADAVGWYGYQARLQEQRGLRAGVRTVTMAPCGLHLPKVSLRSGATDSTNPNPNGAGSGITNVGATSTGTSTGKIGLVEEVARLWRAGAADVQDQAVADFESGHDSTEGSADSGLAVGGGVGAGDAVGRAAQEVAAILRVL